MDGGGGGARSGLGAGDATRDAGPQWAAGLRSRRRSSGLYVLLLSTRSLARLALSSSLSHNAMISSCELSAHHNSITHSI